MALSLLYTDPAEGGTKGFSLGRNESVSLAVEGSVDGGGEAARATFLDSVNCMLAGAVSS